MSLIKTKNPNPDPIGIKFGFLWFGNGARKRWICVFDKRIRALQSKTSGEIFCLTAKCEISAGALVKCSAYAEREMKSTHRRSDFTRRQRISYREAVFHPPVRVDFTEKSTC